MEHGSGPGIQVIARSATVLRLLSEHAGGLSLGAMATHLGLPRSTVQRIAKALEHEGLVEWVASGGFRLGPAITRLAYGRQADIVSEARPLLEALGAELDETVALHALVRDRLVTLDRCVPERTLRVVFPLGALPCSALQLAPGRAILAELPPGDLRRYLAGSVAASAVAPTLEALAVERGAAHDTDPIDAGISGFAVPLRTRLGLYALGAAIPTARATGRAHAIFAALRRISDAITAKTDMEPSATARAQAIEAR